MEDFVVVRWAVFLFHKEDSGWGLPCPQSLLREARGVLGFSQNSKFILQPLGWVLF